MSRGFFVALLGASLLMALLTVTLIPLTRHNPQSLRPIDAHELIASIHRARPGPVAGTVLVDERLGLSALGAQQDSTSGVRTARFWSDGAGRRRISLPSGDGERTIVNDGNVVWFWDSAKRAVIKAPESTVAATDPRRLIRFEGSELMGSPMDTAGVLVTLLEPASVIRTEPTDTVANRPTYELVLDPLPTERTLLREVRVAVDAQTRMPLEVTVLANGSARPVLRIGFSEIEYRPQPPALFTFKPPPGVRVTDLATHLVSATPGTSAHTVLVGAGWDTVLVRRLPHPAGTGPVLPPPPLYPRSTPISGSWGHGRLISTAIGNAVLTSDDRLALGAVPAQVLTEALSR